MLLVAAAAAVTACSGPADPQLAIMEESSAQLPDWVSSSEGIPVKDLARVADVDQMHVFASRDSKDSWCVILAVEPTSGGSDWSVTYGCAPSERFAADGVWVKMESSTRGGGALLLPDDFSGQMAAGWEQINDNLAVSQ